MARFLTHLAVNRDVAGRTQNQALSALVFLYRHVVERPLGEIPGVTRVRRPPRLPVVLTVEEVSVVLARLDGVPWRVACLLYGSGLRLMEAMRLRVKDVEFPRRCVVVRDGKGGKDREELVVVLHAHLEWRREIDRIDRARGVGAVYLPHALRRGGLAVRSPLGAALGARAG